jgi:lipopolysaccharide/colanic/teichoic acid biosynthesis glycosyltransferase
MQIENLQHRNSTYKYVKIRKELPLSPAVDSFVYVGNDEEVFNELSANFKTAHSCVSLANVSSLLSELNHSATTPQFLFIDIPFSASALTSLKKFLSTDTAFTQSYIFYNIRQLTAEERKQIVSLKLVDDLVDLKTEMALVSDKIVFLKKIKSEFQQRNQQIKIETQESDVTGSIGKVKRMVDVLIASLSIILLLPVFALIALAIKLESRGPVFYNSYRAGRGYNIFKFFKFRTMKVGADRMINSMLHLNKYNTSLGPVFFKIQNDPRITKVGSFLRTTGMDELPQLFNVLIGDMSIVGNRPLPLYEASTLTTDVWAERFMAPAGITGLWQIMNRKNAIVSVEERISIDIEYARSNNFLMDFSIMLNTPGVIIKEIPIPENNIPQINGSVKLQPEFSHM